MKYIIYKITNNLNGKIYIGKHKTERLDDNYFGSGKILKQAIKKYGKENFTFHLEFELQNEEEMDLLEKCVVNMDFLKRKDIYNLMEGGQGGHFTEHIKQKMRKPKSEIHKLHLSQANKGKPKSEEHKLHMIESIIKFPVVQFTLDLKKVAEYKSVSEAERQTCINKGNISLCCLGKRKSAGGFVWKYKEYKTDK